VPCGRLSWLLVRFLAHVNIVVDDYDDVGYTVVLYGLLVMRWHVKTG